MSMKPLPDTMNTVGLIAGELLGTFTWSPNWLRDTYAIKDRFNLARLMFLSGRYFDGKGHS